MQPKHQPFRAILLLAILACGLHTTSYARRNGWNNTPFGKGDNTLAAGVGFGLDFGFTPAAVDKPGFLAIYDHGLMEMGLGTITLGGIVSYKSAQHKYNLSNYSASWTHVMAGVRSTLRITALSNRIPALDAYAGVMLGARMWNYSDDYLEALGGMGDKGSGLRVHSGPFIGAKYNIGSSFGVWTEVGYDVALVKLGLHVNF